MDAIASAVAGPLCYECHDDDDDESATVVEVDRIKLQESAKCICIMR